MNKEELKVLAQARGRVIIPFSGPAEDEAGVQEDPVRYECGVWFGQDLGDGIILAEKIALPFDSVGQASAVFQSGITALHKLIDEQFPITAGPPRTSPPKAPIAAPKPEAPKAPPAAAPAKPKAAAPRPDPTPDPEPDDTDEVSDEMVRSFPVSYGKKYSGKPLGELAEEKPDAVRWFADGSEKSPFPWRKSPEWTQLHNMAIRMVDIMDREA